MFSKRRVTLNFDVTIFADRDYDQNDRLVDVDVVDGLELTSIVSELPDDLLRQLGHYLQNSPAGSQVWCKGVPQFMIGNPEDPKKDRRPDHNN
jgi:hypothetical protein